MRTAAVYRVTEQGNLVSTENPYDMAIQGMGFFHVTMPDGTDAYTRDGSFALSPQGQLVTSKGYVVVPGKYPWVMIPSCFAHRFGPG